MKVFFCNIRLACFLFSWLAAVTSTLWHSSNNLLVFSGTLSFGVFLALAIFKLRLQSFLILLFLASLAVLLLPKIPTWNNILEGGKYILMFAGLIPTIALVKSTAFRMCAIHKSQAMLAKLPNRLAISGFQIYAHFFGSVLNTGVFALLSAAVPPLTIKKNRINLAMATLRGMVSSATWSPFFVAFVIGQIYIDSRSAWLALPIGLAISLSFSLASIVFFSKNISVSEVYESTECLRPVFVYLVLIITIVLFFAISFDLTALSAIITVMPLLVGVYLFFSQSHVKPILTDTLGHLKDSSDDVVIISAAMLVGYFVTNLPDTSYAVSQLGLSSLPDWCVLLFIPLVMSAISLIGVHPVISSTVLLSVFTSENFNINHTLIMQAHLIGWSTGTMCSIASLSVITCSNLFKISNTRLCFGMNTIATLFFALFGGLFLTIIEVFY